MTYITTYDIGDYIWTMRDNKVVKIKIEDITIYHRGHVSNSARIRYNEKGSSYLRGQDCFISKEELLKSL